MTVRSGKGWTMHLGDCLQVLPGLAPVDHVITDPPYEAEAHTKGRRLRGLTMANGERAVREAPLSFAAITEQERLAAAIEFGRLARRWCLVFCQAEAAHLWRDAAERGPLRSMRWCVWTKPDAQPQLTGDRPGVGYETIVALHPKGRARWNGGGRVGVFVHNKKGEEPGKNPHPTMKPTALFLELVALFTDPEETILDAFAGSGTTGIAALRLGRCFVGIEKDPTYFDLACERLAAEEQGSTLAASRAGQGALFGAR